MNPRPCEPEALLNTSSADFSPVRLFDAANPIPRILYAEDDACIRKLRR